MVNIFFARLFFPFSMQLLSVSSFRFLFPSWNNPWIFLPIVSMLQCFQTMLLMFGKKRL